MAEQPTAEDLIRQKLQQMLARGTTPQPGQSPMGGTTPPFVAAPGTQSSAPGTGAAASAGNDPNKPTPPTITPSDQQTKSASMAPASAATVQPKPYQTDEEWAKANPGSAPTAPDAYKEPGLRSTLLHSLAAGAIGFGNAGAGERYASNYVKTQEDQSTAAKTAAKNYPTTLHQAREKEEMNQADLAQKQATTAEVQKRTQLMGTSPEPKTTREALESQFRSQTEKGDQNGANVTLDMMHRLYPNEFKDADSAEMAKIPPQVLAEVGPKPVTPVWGPAGTAPTTYKSTAEAQAAWGSAIDQHAIDLAGKEEAAKAKAAAANKPETEPSWQLQEDPDGKPVWVNPKTREVRPAEGVQKSGTQQKLTAEQEKAAKPFQDTLDTVAEAKEFAANPSATSDYGLTMAFIGVTKPENVGKLRLNPQELKLTIGARSSLGDLEALATKVANGQSLTPEQRQQMISTMEVVEKYAKAGIERAGQKKATSPAAQGALPPGWK